ncbi:Hypothetical predicted protein [Octopus vulgaris]|uniref:Endonuclease/exonuclease/phosphatase domain-containing protein n=2 Tax=Octopus vulgaris TaxID=6645 RepID=A0AA36B8N0_OCTVU|nr:Hypothetical predicted protein [Octopus vulgaris]
MKAEGYVSQNILTTNKMRTNIHQIKDMTTSNNQSDGINDEIVVESDSPKASSSNHYNSSGARCKDIFEIKDSECVAVDAISTAANKEPIYIDLTALSDEEDDSIKEPDGSNMEADISNMETDGSNMEADSSNMETDGSNKEPDGSNMKADDFRSPIVEYRVGCKGKQQSRAVLPPKCASYKNHLLQGLDSNCLKTRSSQDFYELCSIDPGPFAIRHRSSSALHRRRDSPIQAHCSTESLPGHLDSGRPWKLKQPNNFINSSEPCSDFFKMFHPPRTAYTERQKKFSRHWNWTNFGIKYHQEPRQQCGFEFSIMSYNILAQDLLEYHKYLYTYCKSKILSWEYRRWCLLKEIDTLSPDIMCLQEVQQDHYETFFKPEFEKRGYEGVFCPKSNYQSDGCATFYKIILFVQISSDQVDYMKGGVLDRGNVGLIVGLKPRNLAFQKNNSCFYVANTHLLFNPRRGDVKLAQLIVLLTELEKIAFKCKISQEKSIYHPFILCGDFNTEPFSQIYNFIMSSYLRYEDLLIREMSGQTDEMYGRNNYLSRDFFPGHLNINNCCQYIHVFQRRNEGCPDEQTENSDVSPKEETVCSTPNDDAVDREDSRESSSRSRDRTFKELIRPFQKGVIKHSFNLMSVYKHVTQVRGRFRNEVSTYHNKCCSTVDYIFYTVDSKLLHKPQCSSSTAEGKLKLICYYQLPSTQEVKEFDKLPNTQLGSDHFSLLASFLLL